MPGYSKDRFIDLNERDSQLLMCSICRDILKNPKDIKCCRHLYCNECIMEWMSRSNTCPHCRHRISFRMSLREPSIIVSDLLSRLKIKCDFAENGCQSELNLDEFSKHVEKCAFNPKRIKELEDKSAEQVNQKSKKISKRKRSESSGKKSKRSRKKKSGRKGRKPKSRRGRSPIQGNSTQEQQSGRIFPLFPPLL